MTAAVVARQVKVSEYEAGFSLACTLAVCLHQELGSWHHMGAAVAIPVAMAFSVHGLNNAKGLGLWNWAYIPARIIVIALGVAYSYQHYYHFLPTLEIGGLDLRPGVAFIMELLTLSALIAHEGHSTRLHTLTPTDPPSAQLSAPVDDAGLADELPAETEVDAVSDVFEPSGRVPASVSFVPPLGAFTPPSTGGGSTKPTINQLNGVNSHE